MSPQLQSPARARRFPLRLRLRYRAAGEKRWHSGVTENVSCSGVLVRGRRVLAPAATVEILLAIPPELAGEAQVHVLCRGQIVRMRPRRFPLLPSALGIRVIDYELVEAPIALEQHPRMPAGSAWLVEIAHELNNMLAVVIGSTELLSSDAPSPEAVHQHAGNIQRAAQRAAHLVQQMLARGRYEEERRSKQTDRST